MKQEDYQTQVAAFVQAYNLESSLETKILDLVSEVGELSKDYLEATSYGRQEFEISMSWKHELGDVFYSLISIANETQVDLESALSNSMAKYVERMNSKGHPGSS